MQSTECDYDKNDPKHLDAEEKSLSRRILSTIINTEGLVFQFLGGAAAVPGSPQKLAAVSEFARKPGAEQPNQPRRTAR